MRSEFVPPFLAVILLMICLLPVASVAAPPPLTQEVISRSLVSAGDTSRLQAVMAKGRRGEPLSIAVMGGSITQGSSASSTDKNYGSLVGKWWKTSFPNSRVRFTNAGIGATGSDYGALRFTRDLGKVKPDVVILEFAVNDEQSAACGASMEGLVRQILKMENHPAVMLLFTMHENGTNAQEWHSEVGFHYGLPMVSMRDALWPEIIGERMNWKDVEADSVHPNDLGHSYLAKFVTAAFGDILAKLPADDAIKAPSPMPKPLYTDSLEYVTLFEGNSLKAVKAEGWAFDKNSGGWKSKVPGSVIEFEVNGCDIYLMAHHVNGPMGIAKVMVDDEVPVIIDGWFDQTWGTWKKLEVVAWGMDPGVHKVKIELLALKNASSKGNQFIINAVGSAGATK